MPNPKNGPSTPMPSVQLDLGLYVTVRPRKDGKARVLFEVPSRLRPSDWSPTIPLPIDGSRTGDLTDADEVARIQADAKTLLDKLRAMRMGREVASATKSMRALVRSWQQTPRYKAKKPATQKGYDYHAGLIIAWAESQPRAVSVPSLKLEPIEQFLAFYDDRPTTRRHLKIVLSMLMDRAIQIEWRTSNPLDTVTMGAPESSVTIWEQADVDFYSKLAKDQGQPSIAAMIQTFWEIGPRVTDGRRFRHTADYADGAFRFYQSKTKSYVTIKVSEHCQKLIEDCRREGSLYLFTDAATGKPWDEQRLGHVFGAMRDIKVDGETGRHLVLRALRHSCVVQLARAGCTVPQIASVTGHAPATAASILAKYLPQDSELAAQAQAQRGLVENMTGTGV